MTLLTSYFVSKKPQYEYTDDAILSLSKGKSSNQLPVYDLWVFDNGHIIYKGISNVEKEGVHKTIVSIDIVDKIKSFIMNLMPNDIGDAKGRDNPLNMIKYGNKKIVYQTARAKGNLLELDNLLDHIAENINKDL